MGVDVAFDDAGAKRPFICCVVGDSGALAYCSKTARNLNGLLKHPADVVKYKWEHATLMSGSGWTAKEMTQVVKTFIESWGQKKTPDGGGNLLFPADMPCVVFDNLNACFAQQGKGDKWHGLRRDVEWPEIAALMDLMVDNFRSAIYVCTATAERWNIHEFGHGPHYDQNSSEVRMMARDKGLTCWTGQSFWNDLGAYKQSWNAYHHGEPGNFCNITYLWDNILLHIYLYCITNSASKQSLTNCNRLKAFMIKGQVRQRLRPSCGHGLHSAHACY
jgi:hypothetical protein